ncbi:MAG: BolA family transcriptional regulator [Alphaproteobacteria bacterium]|nr:MAG: BolA family transcriptional regulator [Alphaproteobacteria bacterium]
MSMDQDTLIKLIQDHLPDASVRLDDLRGDGEHYAAHISCASFKGKSRVQQHQMVYAALGTKMGNELHALQIHTSVSL